MLKLKGITKDYVMGEDTIHALKGIDLEFRESEFVAILGHSGCGKTTLLNIIGLLDTPTSGDYFLNGVNVRRISTNKKSNLRSSKIGFIFQNYNLIDSMPIIENVALPLLYSGAHKTSRLIRASEALERFNLKQKEYYYPNQLSGGQQQRAAIARAIVSSPEIILADEPTGNLDSRTSKLVMEELCRIHEEGNTIIMVTHNPDLVSYATRVIRILDGSIDMDVKTVDDEDLPVKDKSKKKKKKKKKSNNVVKRRKK